MRTSNALIMLAAVLASGTAFGQGATDDKAASPRKGIEVKPVILDGKDSGGAAVGLQYSIEKTWRRNFDENDAGKKDFDPDARLGALEIELKGSGTVAANKERNPNKLLDLATNGYYLGSSALATYGLGGMLKYETDQGFDNKQSVYGLTGVLAKMGGIFPANDFGLVQVGYGRVSPKGDAERKKALGAMPLTHFNRWEAELYYRHQLSGALRGVEFQYRYFHEVDAPPVVKAARIDRFRLGTIRVNLKEDRFIAFSSGSLPFDRKKDRTVTIGWTYKLE